MIVAHSSITGIRVFTVIGPHARTLELPLLVRPGYRTVLFLSFSFFCLKLKLREPAFAVRSPPSLSRRGNFRRLGARFNYSSSHGRGI